MKLEFKEKSEDNPTGICKLYLHKIRNIIVDSVLEGTTKLYARSFGSVSDDEILISYIHLLYLSYNEEWLDLTISFTCEVTGIGYYEGTYHESHDVWEEIKHLPVIITATFDVREDLIQEIKESYPDGVRKVVKIQ